MADGPPPDVRLADLRHGDGALDAGVLAVALQARLKRQAVDDGGQHAHEVGGRPLHAALAGRLAAPDVAAADDDGYLHAKADDATDLMRHVVQDIMVNRRRG